ncbi:transposable element Tcb1 transposase [Trichonephila clavipes]|nr:transposable element Tcb1 transposase [Trichonephila clavipes]
MRICDRWMQEGTADRRGRSHLPQCTTSLSARTIRRRLQQSDLSARRPLLGLPLTQNHRRLRRQWFDKGRMRVAAWNEVVFTDESRICLQHHDGRIRVWRHREERMLNSCLMHRHTGSAPGIMITPPAATPDRLWQSVEAAWSAVPQEQSLFESMPRRLAAGLKESKDVPGSAPQISTLLCSSPGLLKIRHTEMLMPIKTIMVQSDVGGLQKFGHRPNNRILSLSLDRDL